MKKKLPPSQSAFNTLLRDYKKDRNKTTTPFSLTNEDFRFLTSSNCFYCGSPPSKSVLNGQGKNSKKFNGDYIYNGIDRIDNSVGYVIENCVSCCLICNRAKRDLHKSDFIKWIKKISEYSLNINFVY